MPGSLTTRSRTASRDDETACVAFGVGHTLGAPDGITIAARWLACAHPYRRFASVLAGRRARLGADVGRYSFIAEDLHLLSPAGLPAHARINKRSPPQGAGYSGVLPSCSPQAAGNATRSDSPEQRSAAAVLPSSGWVGLMI
jgi:hypothetical protein